MLLYAMLNDIRDDDLDSALGIDPENAFFSKCIYSRFVKLKQDGIGPDRLLAARSKKRSFVSWQNSSGTSPSI